MQSDFSSPGVKLGLNDGTLGLVGIAILLVGAVLWSTNGPGVEKTDFSLTYVGAYIVHSGQGDRLYDLALQRQVRDSLFAHPNPLFYEHPPFEAILLSALARFRFATVYLIWGFFNVAVWLTTMFFLRRYLPWPREDLGYVTLWLLFAPLGDALYQGQSSVLLLALYALAFVQLKNRHDFAAGLCLGFGLIKLQFVLPFAFIFLLRRKWRFLTGFAVTSLFLGAVSIVAIGRSGLHDYARFLLTIGNNPQNVSYGSGVDMPTIHGFVYAMAGRWVSHTGMNATVAILSLALLVFVAWHWKEFPGEGNDLIFAAAVTASLVAGSHMFMHDFSPLILAMFLAGGFAGAHSTRYKRWLRLALMATLVVFWAFPVYFLFVKWHCLYLMCPVLLLFLFAAAFGATFAASKRTTDQQSAAIG